MHFLVNVIDNRSNSATAAELAAIETFNDRLRSRGHWVFAGGLADPADSTVVDGRGATPMVTDGPFVEAKEWAAGFWLIEADDHDTAVALMLEGSQACGRRLELRPLLG